ncbi:hypothetical protein [Kordia sp.]|uniref:hypothetical protein n=1 Tax=Kordia sp. TaxID=1965332 RepID=UPI003D287C8D
MKQTILSDRYEAFMEQSNDTIKPLINTDSEDITAVFRNYKYPISSYPVILSKENSQKLEEVSTLIPKLLQKIPKLYFQDDIKKIADFYFNGDEMVAQYSMMCQEREVPVSSRLDLTLTETGFKVLEINLGSSIGGIGLQNFEPSVRNTHNVLSNTTTRKQFTFHKSQNLYIQFIVAQILAYTQTKSSKINLFLVSDAGAGESQNATVKDFFNELLQKELQRIGKIGNVYMDAITSLKMQSDGLYFKENCIHSVLILDFAQQNMSADLVRSFIMNMVYFPDHLGTTFMRDKRNLTILRKLASEGKFEGTQNELVLHYIPWTEVIEDIEVLYEGKTQNIIELLKENKDKFVIKIIDGLQGKDVFIGKFTSKTDWENAIKEALNDKKYIAQKFSDSLNLLAPNKENAWTPHKLIWGSFGFGDTYGGSWVRMSEEKTTSGVINAATGAVEAIVYECIS